MYEFSFNNLNETDTLSHFLLSKEFCSGDLSLIEKGALDVNDATLGYIRYHDVPNPGEGFTPLFQKDYTAYIEAVWIAPLRTSGENKADYLIFRLHCSVEPTSDYGKYIWRYLEQTVLMGSLGVQVGQLRTIRRLFRCVQDSLDLFLTCELDLYDAARYIQTLGFALEQIF
ncbi:hypothetical protein OPT61_g6398 [Boeremia exigua]|uniref:Uncharacterized protein n=1 Tax=Boeremia exigua TaxID=749465 RepID=A0ACC2I6U7_9PLEO|nr:hypothetical protein OPT61_g6398 [Boeremia exigua]